MTDNQAKECWLKEHKAWLVRVCGPEVENWLSSIAFMPMSYLDKSLDFMIAVGHEGSGP